MGQLALQTYSLETYLQLEAEGDQKYEYEDGYILAMAGGEPRHGELAGNAITSLNNALRAKNKPCRAHSSDVKVSVRAVNRRYYPDVSVVRGEVERDELEPKAITNPILLVEVLSDSTEVRDRGPKFRAYRQLPSLREYVLIKQEEMVVEVFSRNEDGSWRIQSATEREDKVELPSLEISLSLADLYYGVKFGEEK